MCIWFSQYMLVWYGDIGEETAYYNARLHNAWAPLFLLNMVLNWAVPFAALLPRGAKRSPRVLGTLAGAAGILVLGFYRGIHAAAPVPVNDPYLEESLHYHNA